MHTMHTVTRDDPMFRAEMSALPGPAEPVRGLLARLVLADGRQVDIHVPKALHGVLRPCDVTGFRVVVRQSDDVVAAELSAMDLEGDLRLVLCRGPAKRESRVPALMLDRTINCR